MRDKLGPRNKVRSWKQGGASVCMHMHSYASVGHPHAPICFDILHVRLRTLTFHTHFPRQSKKSRSSQLCKITIVLCIVESARMQPDKANLVTTKQIRKQNIWRNHILCMICRIRFFLYHLGRPWASTFDWASAGAAAGSCFAVLLSFFSFLSFFMHIESSQSHRQHMVM